LLKPRTRPKVLLRLAERPRYGIVRDGRAGKLKMARLPAARRRR
jgi:hypothetical protein